MLIVSEELVKQYDEITKVERQIAHDISELPKGKLRISNSRGKPIYFIKTETGEQYIKKNQFEYAQKLAQRSYLEDLRKEIVKQKICISKFLQTYSEKSLIKPYQKLSKARKEIVNPIYVTNEEYARQWEEQPFKPKIIANNESEIYTEKGERVRSKSEKIIADKLFMMNIPYKYECPLNINGFGIVYPDFTVLNVRERKVYYWEHFGMMDNEQYCNNAIRKVETYQKGEITQGNELLLSFETSSRPLNINYIEGIINTYLV